MLPIPESASAPEILSWAIKTFGPRLAVSTSFQKEGMVIVDMAAKISPAIRVFTLDTGRLPQQTIEMIVAVKFRYRIDVEAVRPDASEVASMVETHGTDLFYQDVSLRQLCCHIRKVRPLERKLAELDAWVTGLRRDQSDTRAETPKIDSSSGKFKISPIADWTAAQVDEYIERNRVPLHPLYAQGYTSIGCAPCTRPVAPGEDERAGRWWWEQDAHKECGIHFSPDGKPARALDVLLEQVLASKNAA